ncbi:CMGC/CDK/CDK9 protein kinase [Puccinia striiformis f. sp. tritici PST-78]|uniref:[RNA-polymerase]-subunit kinase n=1 Tax=Puccinia striiformis f. sp. tritici PST-78 TaxID=1165861 RepID=A0A0L0VWF3_9BASI|nr:CMGC/CDK/CDK9 protein kinase [Puccinia striiformis f. sp. tritici PST-78]
MNSLEEGEVEDSTTAATLPPLLPPPPAFNSLPPKPATNTNTAINSLSRPPLPPPSSSSSNWNRSHTHSPQKAATIYLSPDRNRRTHSRSRSRSPQLNRSRNRGSSSTNSYSQTQSNHPRSSSHSPSRTPTKRQRHLSRSPHPPLPPTHLNLKPQNKANLLTAELLSSPQKPHHQNNAQESSDQSKISADHQNLSKNTYQNYQPTFFFHRLSKETCVNHESMSPKDLQVEGGPTKSSKLSENQLRTTKKPFIGVSSIKSYELVEKLGEGTFGEVFKGIYRGKLYAQQQKLEQGSSSNRNIDGNLDHPGRSESEEEEDDDHVDCETTTKKDDGGVHSQKSRVKAGMVVALKRIIVHNELDGLPITALREIRILKSLDHPNIVPVIDISYSKGNLKLLKRGNTYMVFPYIDHDLAGLIENKSITFNVSQIKLYSKQLLLGTAYLHRNKILHRDLKAANLLISNEGQLMIADFGLARSIEQQHNNKKREYTNCVVTRWYRPPEILLGNRRYGTAVDLWGVGCVIAEMFKGGPILTGSTDVNQCELIFRLCGSPTAKSMPGWESLPGCEGVRSWANKPRRVKEEYERSSPELADLLDHLLVLDHSRRLTAEEALDHDWFWTDPMAIDPAKLPHYEPSHEYDRRRKQEQAKRTHQHQLASFTEIQGSSSSMTAKANGAHPASKLHRLPPPTSSSSSFNSKPPSEGFSHERKFPSDQFKHPVGPPIPGNRMVMAPEPTQFHRGGGGMNNPGGNPYSSQGSSGMMGGKNYNSNSSEGRGEGDNRSHYNNSDRRNRGGGGQGYGGGGGSTMGSSIAGLGHASLPSRPVSSYDRAPYGLPKSGGAMSMVGGMNGSMIGGMAAGPTPSFPHLSHPLPGHPEATYPLPSTLSAEHGPGDERGQRGYPVPLPGGPSIRDSSYIGAGGGGGGYRNRGGDGGRQDGRSRSNHDRWTPEPSSQLPGGGSGSNPYPLHNSRSADRRHGNGRPGDRRFRNGGGDHNGRDSYQYNNNNNHRNNPSKPFFNNNNLSPQNGPPPPPLGVGVGPGVPNPYASFSYPAPPPSTDPMLPIPPLNYSAHQHNNNAGNDHQRWDNTQPAANNNNNLDFHAPPNLPQPLNNNSNNNNNPYTNHHQNFQQHPHSPPNTNLLHHSSPPTHHLHLPPPHHNHHHQHHQQAPPPHHHQHSSPQNSHLLLPLPPHHQLPIPVPIPHPNGRDGYNDEPRLDY